MEGAPTRVVECGGIGGAGSALVASLFLARSSALVVVMYFVRVCTVLLRDGDEMLGAGVLRSELARKRTRTRSRTRTRTDGSRRKMEGDARPPARTPSDRRWRGCSPARSQPVQHLHAMLGFLRRAILLIFGYTVRRPDTLLALYHEGGACVCVSLSLLSWARAPLSHGETNSGLGLVDDGTVLAWKEAQPLGQAPLCVHSSSALLACCLALGRGEGTPRFAGRPLPPPASPSRWICPSSARDSIEPWTRVSWQRAKVARYG